MAVEGVWHGDRHIEVLELSLRETVDTWNIVGHGKVGLSSSQRVSGLVHIAHVWTSAIGVDLITVSISIIAVGHMTDLMDGDSHLRACLDLGHGTCCQSILRVLANIDVTCQLRTATLVDDVGANLCISDDRCVLLARADSCTIPWQVGINLEADTSRRTRDALV